jgi:hypothetical protein
MENHIRALGIVFVVFGLMGLLGASIVAIIFIGGGMAGSIASDEPIISLIAGSLGIVIVSIILIFSIPKMIVGYGLIKGYKWSYLFGIIISIISLFDLPFGTAAGIYGLWVLTKPESKQILEQTIQST